MIPIDRIKHENGNVRNLTGLDREAFRVADDLDMSPDPFCMAQKDDSFHESMFDRRSRHFDKGGNTHWSVAWSDLMMTMFILFAVLYIYSLANREWDQGKGPVPDTVSENATGPAVEREVIRETFPEIYDLTKKTVSDLGQVELIKDQAVRITLTNDLLFETGKADLKPGALGVLEEVASVIRQTPYMVNVVGHTDDLPIRTDQFPTNWELSAIRSCMVVRFMSERFDIPGRRFFISAHAYHLPLKPNDSMENRAANRRVEIIITRDRPGVESF